MSDSDPPGNIEEQAVRRTMRRVLQAEEDKLHMDSPKGINEEIVAIIEDEVK